MNRWVTLGVLLAAGVALALRGPRLSERPMHNDEGVNAIKFGTLWQGGRYKYDPSEYHGPLLPYATAWLGKLSAAPDFSHYTETRLRLVTVLFGTALLFVFVLMRDGLGSSGLIWAALFAAVSPALVFYSRYYIHETPLAFLNMLALGSAWRYWRSRKIFWALLAGTSIGLMQSTKETFVLSLAAAAVALLLNQLWNRRWDASGIPAKAPPLNYKHLIAGLGCWVLIALLFFSSFFTNLHGPLDSIRTYSAWLGRTGADSPQLQPWYFYFQRLLAFHVHRGPFWSEAMILALALIAMVAAFRRKSVGDASASFLRFLSLYGLILAAIYSLIAYKTPWCLLSFWQIIILLAGSGAAILVRLSRFQWATVATRILLVLGAANLAAQAWQASVVYADDPRNPYVYAQTSSDILGLVDRVEALEKLGPGQVPVQVLAANGDYWPLPWYFRDLNQVAWQEKSDQAIAAPIVVASPAFQSEFENTQTYVMTGFFALRPQILLALYVEKDLWIRYLAKQRLSAERP
jgi:uncharacterized protein (TIGR03663 family)